MAKMMKMAMKVMKPMKMKMAKKAMVMKAMKMKMAMKKSTIAKGKRAKSSVFRGTKVKTSGGLAKADLIKNKNGKVVSKKASLAAKKRPGYKAIAKWGLAVKTARKALGVKGFCAVGGKTKTGAALLAKVRSLYKK